ncbi:hypothetical protein HanPSC8_Chr05g0207161 [Helianthus annuus]|nr:hypothetical protein HanPSC8_Chr05g0207161 [Helianthus annuus]
MVDNVKGEKYIMYPRFIQMLLDDQVPNLPKDPADELKLHHMTSETLNRLNRYKGLSEDQERRVKRMIGKIANPNYVVPENDHWRHAERTSEDETDSLRGMTEKRLRFWYEKDGKRKRTPKVSPKVVAPKVVIKEPAKKKSPQRLVDEPMLNPMDLIQQGVDLMKMTLDDFVKQSEDAKTAKAAKEATKEVETSAKNVEAESLKEKEVEGVVHTDSSETEPEYDTSKLGVGKIKLKLKPQKKNKGSDEEDAMYIPTPEEKKKVIRKRKSIPTGVIPRSIRARKGAATMPEIQSVKAPEVVKHVETTSIPEVEKDQSVEKPEEESKKAPESPIFERVEKDDEDEVEFMGERQSTPPPPPVNPTIHIPDDPKEPSSAKKATTSSSSQGFPTFPDNLGPGPVSLDDIGDLFNEGKINVLTKKVSLLEKATAKAEAERD